ncbi:MAG: hypothetical protein HY689_01375 [Chloroflexi bacterium]|nr:hypothetical protein [Chloroflexota bacterium]
MLGERGAGPPSPRAKRYHEERNQQDAAPADRVGLLLVTLLGGGFLVFVAWILVR